MSSPTDYAPVSSFKEVYDNIVELTKTPIRNLVYKFEIQVDKLNTPEFAAEFDEAKLWQSEACPKCLHFSHKEYFGSRGIEHVKDVLSRKPNSKRALLSLISQNDINDTGDKPIPSFMLAQYSVEGDSLYATFYYRALETSSFLKINLEEFRMLADEIKPQCVKQVRGTIISFYAYQEQGFTNLKKNRLDYISTQDLFLFLKSPGADLCGLLEELKRPSSVIDSRGVREIANWLETNASNPGLFSESIGIPLFKMKVLALIEKVDCLSALLSRGAISAQIDVARGDVNNVVDELVTLIKG